MNVKNNGNAYSRTGATDKQFYIPVCGSVISFSGVTEVSGFYIELSKF